MKLFHSMIILTLIQFFNCSSMIKSVDSEKVIQLYCTFCENGDFKKAYSLIHPSASIPFDKFIAFITATYNENGPLIERKYIDFGMRYNLPSNQSIFTSHYLITFQNSKFIEEISAVNINSQKRIVSINYKIVKNDFDAPEQKPHYSIEEMYEIKEYINKNL